SDTVFSASTTAAALLFTTSAASAPVNSVSREAQWSYRDPRSPDSRSYSRFVYDSAARSTAARAAAASGARPRFVCSTTPVALITGRIDGRRHAASRARTRSAYQAGDVIP